MFIGGGWSEPFLQTNHTRATAEQTEKVPSPSSLLACSVWAMLSTAVAGGRWGVEGRALRQRHRHQRQVQESTLHAPGTREGYRRHVLHTVCCGLNQYPFYAEVISHTVFVSLLLATE